MNSRMFLIPAKPVPAAAVTQVGLRF